jgi:hypothetical protein
MYSLILYPRQLSALARLGPLSHLDLQLVRVDQVLRRHPEAPTRDLLYSAAAAVAVLIRREPHRVLATLASVGLAAYAVHRDGQGLVRLPRERAERHRARREALDDLPGRLYLFKRYRVLFELEEAAQCGEARALLVEVAGELLEGLEVSGLDGALEGWDRRLVPLVVLALHPELVLAPDL